MPFPRSTTPSSPLHHSLQDRGGDVGDLGGDALLGLLRLQVAHRLARSARGLWRARGARDADRRWPVSNRPSPSRACVTTAAPRARAGSATRSDSTPRRWASRPLLGIPTSMARRDQGHVATLRDRLADGDGPEKLAVGVAGRPRSGARLQRQRLVLEDARLREPAALQGGHQDDGLERASRLAVRLGDPVELAAPEVAAADVGEDGAGMGIDGDQRGFQGIDAHLRRPPSSSWRTSPVAFWASACSRMERVAKRL